MVTLQGSQVSDMVYTEPPIRQPVPALGRSARLLESLFGEINRQKVLLTGFVMAGLVVSTLAGLFAAQSELAKPRLDVVMYVAQDSTAEFFYADEFGLINADRSVSVPTQAGINNISFPLDDELVSSYFAQRFDPCVCDTPVLFESVTLASSVYFQSVPFAVWNLGGDARGLTIQGSRALLETTPTANDPQIFFYLEIDSFSDRAEVVTFWVFFALSGAILLFLVGVIGAWRSVVNTRIASDFYSGRSRRQQANSPVIPLSIAFFAALVAVIGAVQQFAGAYLVGPTIDEPFHVRHLTNFFETGQYSSTVYGPVTSLLGHGVNVVMGVEQWGIPGQSAEAYAIRHLVIAFIGLLGTGAVALTAWMVFGSVRWALVAAAFLNSFPLWVGHSMFNIKDIPLASGYALLTAALVALFADKLSVWSRFAIFGGSLVLAVLIGLGTRPGGAALYLLSVVVAVLVWFIVRGSRFSVVLRLAIGSGVLLVTTMGIFLAIRFTDLGQQLLAGAERSLDFPWRGFNLYAGQRVSERPGVEGIAQVFLAYLPLVMIFFIVAGLVLGVVAVTKWVTQTVERSAFEPSFVLIVTQAFAVFPVIAVFDPAIYDGGRQLLFIFPALALVAVFGLYGVMKALPFVIASGRWERRLVVSVVGVSLALITFEQVRMFPYNYSYHNVIAQGPGLNGRWQTDYWFASTREVAQFITPLDPAVCGRSGSHNFDLGTLPEACGTLLPYVAEGAEAEESLLDERQYWVIRNDRTLWMFGPIWDDNCSFHSEVSRPLRGEKVVMGQAYVCLDK
jgi:hypothetical protein